MVRRGVFAGFLVASLLAGGSGNAQQPGGPSPSQDSVRARAEVVAAMNWLDAFLRTGGSYKSAGWKRYLQWNDLAAIVQSNQPQLEALNAILAKLRGNHAGLERPEFMHLRDALARYAAASGAANRPLPDLVSSIRQTQRRPNFFGYASRRFAATGIERDVDQLTAVNDNILGTSLHGTARLVGRTTLSLNENPSAASMNIMLGGTAWSNNVGYNGPVTIYSTGATSVSARKMVLMNANGLFGYGSQANCCTRSNINGICASCGLIEKIAWRRAGQQKGEAEAIASQHAGWRVAGQMDREAGGLIAEQNARYYDRFRNPLTRRGEFPEELTFSSTRDQIQVRMRQESANLPSAPDDPPGYSAEHDLALRAHESSVVNYAQGVLGGYELTDVRLEKLIRDDLKGEVSDELQVTRPDGTLDPDKEPWSIIFAKELPVKVKFDSGTVWMSIRADGFTRGEGDEPGKYKPAITELLEISALYKIEKTDKGATLRRDGDVQVRFPNRMNPEQVTLRDSPIVTFIRRKFRSLFKDDFAGEGLVFKGQWAKAGTLRLSEIASEGAWLRLGWDMGGATATPAAAGAE